MIRTHVVLALLGAPLIAAATATAAPVAEPEVASTDASLSTVRGVTRWQGRVFTGRAQSRDDAGDIASTRYVNGRREGFTEAWYPDGQLWYRRGYHAGREEGEHQGWWPDGRIHFSYRYHDGKIEDEAIEWYQTGQRYRDMHYRDGQEEGSEQLWYADGTLRANYVTRDGRRYGLPGSKGCFGHDSVTAS